MNRRNDEKHFNHPMYRPQMHLEEGRVFRICFLLEEKCTLTNMHFFKAAIPPSLPPPFPLFYTVFSTISGTLKTQRATMAPGAHWRIRETHFGKGGVVSVCGVVCVYVSRHGLVE